MLFLLVSIPVLFMFAALAIDFARVIEATRSVRQAAEEAAQSGAMSYQLGSSEPTLATTAAQAEARRNWDRAVALGVVNGNDPRLELVVATPREVVIEASAEVKDLIFLRYFTVLSGDATWRVRATGIAQVCLAGFEGEEACTRPDVR